MNTTKTLIAGAAVAGLMAGSLPVRAYAANKSTQAGVSLQKMADKRARIPARDKTPAKAKAAARLVTAVAKAKTPAKAKVVAPLTAESPSNLTGNC
jgi:hypothetical protein